MSDPLDELLEFVKSAVAEVGSAFEDPEEDWEPVMFMVSADGRQGIAWIDPTFLFSEQTKDMLAYKVMPEMLSDFEAVAAAFVSSAWISQRPNKILGKHVKPADQPDRMEAVQVAACTNVQAKSSYASITRHPDAPPELGPWHDYGDGSSLEGRMLEGMRQGLALKG